MIRASIDPTGMLTNLRLLALKAPERIASAIYVEAQIIMTEAKRRCPVAPDGGTLRASGMVAVPVFSGKSISCTLSFGGAASAYAIAVHEHLSEHSPPSWVAAEMSGRGVHWTSAGTGPKFLEGPINEAKPELNRRLARRLHFDTGDLPAK